MDAHPGPGMSGFIAPILRGSRLLRAIRAFITGISTRNSHRPEQVGRFPGRLQSRCDEAYRRHSARSISLDRLPSWF